MSAGPKDDDAAPREPVVEDRGGGESPTIAQAADDVARTVLRDQERTVPVAPTTPDERRRTP